MLIILDRDGVINQDSVDYIKCPDEWIAYPEGLKAIAQLNKAGHKVVVATNQSGVGRGFYTLDMLERIHQKMRAALFEVGAHLDGIYFCPHKPEDHCDCRKPKPGLLKQIANDFPEEFKRAILVGDALRDLQAAQAVGVRPMLVLSGKGQETFDAGIGLENIAVYPDLNAVVEAVLAEK